jgi:hypothetical protein
MHQQQLVRGADRRVRGDRIRGHHVDLRHHYFLQLFLF